MTSIDYQLLKSSFKESIRQAGAELCQAQGKLVWFDLSLKFSWSILFLTDGRTYRSDDNDISALRRGPFNC